MMDDKEFLEELRQLIIRRGAAENLVDTLALVNEVSERLSEDPVFGEIIPTDYTGSGTRGRNMKVHGFTRPDDSDGSMSLVVGRWDDSTEPGTLTSGDVSKLSSLLENFILEAG